MSTKKIRTDFSIFATMFSNFSKAENIHPFQMEKIDNKFERLQRTRPWEALLDSSIVDEIIARVNI